MSQDNLTCKHCGHDRFHALQRCRGDVSVIVILPVDGCPEFLRNATEDGRIDPNDLAWDNVRGPFLCAECGKEFEEVDE